MLKSKTMRNVIKFVVSLTIIGGFGSYLWAHWEVFANILNASWHHILFLVICIFAMWLLNSYQTMVILKPLGVNISFLENTALLIGMRLGNYLPLKAGSILRIQYYKKVHGLEYLGFTSLTGVRLLIIVISTGILGLVAMLGISTDIAPDTAKIFYLLFCGMIVSFVVFLIIPLDSIKWSRNIRLGKISEHLVGVMSIRSSPRILMELILLGILQMFLLAIRLYISFDAVQVELSLWLLLFIAPLTTLLTFVSLVPGNLGLREWIIGLISVITGINVESGIFAGTVDRAVLIAVTFVFGIASILYIKARIKHKLVEES